VTAPTLTTYQGPRQNPRVEVFFPELLPGTASHTIIRESDGRRQEVRRGLRIAPGVAALDYEVPFCVPSVYRAECFNAAGESIGFTEPATTMVWETRSILHQPMNPQLWATSIERTGTADKLVRPSPGENVWPEGATYARRIGQKRRGLVDVNYIFQTFDTEEADRVQALTGTPEEPYPAIICIRTPPPVRLPRTLFLSVDELVEIDQNVSYGGNWTVFEITGDECEPPYVGLSTPTLTYSDIDAAYGSYALADAAYSTYTERDRDYSLAGTA
jgi:hypothetical protein